MSVNLYDEAFLKKLQHWTEKTNIHVYGTGDIRSLLETSADETGDTPVALPVLSLVRDGVYDIVVPNTRPMVYDGVMTDATYDKSYSLNAIPISITYQIDVWTRYFKEADEYMRNLIFNIITYPKLEVLLDYNNREIIHQSSLHIATGVMDTTDAGFKLSNGSFTRLSLGVIVDDAYLWDLRTKQNVHIGDVIIE